MLFTFVQCEARAIPTVKSITIIFLHFGNSNTLKIQVQQLNHHHNLNPSQSSVLMITIGCALVHQFLVWTIFLLVSVLLAQSTGDTFCLLILTETFPLEAAQLPRD